MGARQSKRSVDITTSPKKGDEILAAAGEGKLEKIPDLDQKIATNGVVAPPHSDIEFADKEEVANDLVEESKDEPALESSIAAKQDNQQEIKENGVSETSMSEETTAAQQEDDKTAESNETAGGDQTLESSVEKSPSDTKTEEQQQQQELKKKDKSKKKKWSFRSISFSKKDKSKPQKGEDKNAEVKEVAEENAEEPVSPTVQETPKVEDEKTDKVQNGGDATVDEEKTEKVIVKEEAPKVEQLKIVEEEKPVVEVVEVPKVEEPPKEEVKVAVPEPKVEVVVQPAVVVVDDKVEDVKEQVKEEPPKEIEVRKLEDSPPPLPASNPPSPVTVFAESTKDEPIQDPIPVEISIPEVAKTEQASPLASLSTIEPPVSETNNQDTVKEETDLIQETIAIEQNNDLLLLVDKQEVPIVESSAIIVVVDEPIVVEQQEVEEDSVAIIDSTPPPSLSQAPESVSLSEPICNNADSLPDISTESLPSLPEPISESLPEPMSLPPVEFVPEPIAPVDTAAAAAASLSLPTSPVPQELTEELNEAPALTNGSAAKTNGFHSPTEDLIKNDLLQEVDFITNSNITKEGLKQVQNVGDAELRQENAEKIEAVAELTPATTTVEE